MHRDDRESAGRSMIRSVGDVFGKKLRWFIAGFFILLTVPALSQVNNCCSVDRQCTTDDDWDKGYYAYQNNQCAAPADSQQQPMSSSQLESPPAPTTIDEVDNCCFVDRQCSTDEEWINGYNAYQSGQCAAPAQQQSQARQAQQYPSQVNNCCFSGWQCNTDEEWTSGYWAFQHDHCASQSHWEEQMRKRQQRQRSSDSHNPNPVSRTYDPETRTTTFTYEDGSQIIVRPPTLEELCEALERDGLPLLPECEED